MIDSVFRESKNKLIDYKIERIKGTLTEVNLNNKSNILNTTSTQTNIQAVPNVEKIITIKTFYKSTKSIANGSGYSAAKFLK